MYEENLEPLPPGDAIQAFAPLFAEMQQTCQLATPPPVTPDQVMFWADTAIQSYLTRLSRRLLLPGSGLDGLENLQQLVDLSAGGAACIMCLNHRSNLDVPTLCALLQDAGHADLFDQIIWIAGRKLQEDPGMTGMLVQAFNRVVVTPRSWIAEHHSPDELHEGHLVNMAAHRVVHKLRHEGRVFALFPTGTRIRPGDTSTTRAIPETDTWLKSFEYMLLGYIDGCTLPVSRDQDMTRETPVLNRITISFDEVLTTDDWRRQAIGRFPGFSQRAATAAAIMDDILRLQETAK